MSLLAQGEDVFAVRKGAARHASAVKKVQAPLHCTLHAEAACTCERDRTNFVMGDSNFQDTNLRRTGTPRAAVADTEVPSGAT